MRRALSALVVVAALCSPAAQSRTRTSSPLPRNLVYPASARRSVHRLRRLFRTLRARCAVESCGKPCTGFQDLSIFHELVGDSQTVTDSRRGIEAPEDRARLGGRRSRA